METDFESGQDSSILIRKRTRGSKLKSAFQKRKGILVDQTDHTIKFLPAGKTNITIQFCQNGV